MFELQNNEAKLMHLMPINARTTQDMHYNMCINTTKIGSKVEVKKIKSIIACDMYALIP